MKIKFPWFKKPQKAVQLLSDPSPLRVIEVETETDNLLEALGIDQARGEELTKIVLEGYSTSKNLVEAMVDISSKCKHANELFITSWMLHEAHRKNQMVNGLMGLLGR